MFFYFNDTKYETQARNNGAGNSQVLPKNTSIIIQSPIKKNINAISQFCVVEKPQWYSPNFYASW